MTSFSPRLHPLITVSGAAVSTAAFAATAFTAARVASNTGASAMSMTSSSASTTTSSAAFSAQQLLPVAVAEDFSLTVAVQFLHHVGCSGSQHPIR